MKKLVRDKIPEFAKYAKYRKLNFEEIENALKDKIVEEALEVKDSTNDQNLIEELGDVYSVINAFLDFKKIDKTTFLKRVAEKDKVKGPFSKYLLMEVDNKDN